MTVVDPRTLTALWTDQADDATKQAHMAAAQQGVEQLIADVGTQPGLDTGVGFGVAVTVRVLFGHPVNELVDAAADAELLVVGSRNENGLGRMLLGSVSSGVVHHAHCPVTVVKP